MLTPSGVAFEHWADASFPITWRLNTSRGSNITGSRPLADAAKAAFASWAAAPAANVSFAEGAETANASAALDGVNLVSFVPSSYSGDAASLSVIYSFTAAGTDPLGRPILFPGQILEADILVNPNAQFTSDATPTPGRIDLESRLRHEIGHLLGLDHSGLLSAVMYPTTEPGVIRTLSIDDQIGLSVLYPAATFFATRGTIRGSVKTPGGAVVYGAHVVVQDAQGKAIVSTVTGPDGLYQIPGLEPGSYAAYAEPLDSPLVPADVESLAPLYPDQTVNANFTTRFAQATGSASSDLNLTKTAGDNQAGVAGQALSVKLEVEVRDSNNTPQAGVPVTFRAISGGGTVVPIEATSDAQGRSRAQAYLGSSQNQAFTATAGTSVVTFSESAAPSAIASIVFLDANLSAAKEIIVSEGATDPIRTRVFDNAGGVLNGVAVTYNTTNPDIATVDGSGSIHALRSGFTTIRAAAGGVVAASTVTVVQVNTSADQTSANGVAADPFGRLYLAAPAEHTILFAPGAAASPSLYAGIRQSAGSENSSRLQSRFNSPSFLALNPSDGVVYVSDTANNLIRKITPGPNGSVETLAGTGVAGSLDGAAQSAQFRSPKGLALDNAGNLWVADSGNHTIRRINLISKTVDTVAGLAGASGNADGTGNAARFSSPAGIAFEGDSVSQQLDRFFKAAAPSSVRIVVADAGNGRIRRISASGVVETIEDSGTISSLRAAEKDSVFLSDPKIPLSFASPTGIAVDAFGNVYLTEPGSNQVKAILPNGQVVEAAPRTAFNGPAGLAIGRRGRLLVAAGDRPVKEVVYGTPEITSITPDTVSNAGGASMTVRGKNFAPGGSVVIAGTIISNVSIPDTETLIFTVPALPSGRTTLTVTTRGGLAQKSVQVSPIPLSSLPVGNITTVAGGSTFAGDGEAAELAELRTPTGLATDPAGNLLIADSENARIRRVDMRTGIVTTVAGNGIKSTFEGTAFSGTAALATPLTTIHALAADGAGNIYFADVFKINKVEAATGLVRTISNTAFVENMAADPAGNLYFTTSSGSTVQKLSTSNTVTTFAGGGSPADGIGDNLPATQASLSSARGLALDARGNLFIADYSHRRVRKVGPDGIITTVAGNGGFGPSGNGGPALNASLELPDGIAVDADGNLYIVSGFGAVRKVDKDGIINAVTSLSVNWHYIHLAADAAGNVHIADKDGDRVIRIADGSTVAGCATQCFTGDGGPAVYSRLTSPQGLAIGPSGAMVIADFLNHRLRRVDNGTIVTRAGNGRIGHIQASDGQVGTNISLFFPKVATVDGSGSVYFIDANLIRKIDASTGALQTVAQFSGTGEALALDPSGALFAAVSSAVAGVGDHIYKIVNGSLVNVAGNTQTTFAGDGGPAASASLNKPKGIAFDAAGNLFIADNGNRRVRKVGADGNISTAAGDGSTSFNPTSVAADASGNVYVAENLSIVGSKIRKLTNGVLTIVANSSSFNFSGDGGRAVGAGFQAAAIAVDASGNIYIADAQNGRIRAVRGPLP